MTTANVGIEEARKRLGDLVTAVQQGTDVIITRNGRPAARLTAHQEETMFVVYRDATGANQIEQCDKAKWGEIAASADKKIICVTEIEDVARRARGVEARDLGNGIRLSGRIDPTAPAGPGNDRFEYLVDYRTANAQAITLHVWAHGPDDFPDQLHLAIAAMDPSIDW